MHLSIASICDFLNLSMKSNSAPLKIHLMIDSLISGGAQRQIVTLANELANRGCQINLITYYRYYELYDFVRSEVRLVHIDRKSKIDIAYMFRIWRFFRLNKPHCLISYLRTPSFFARILGRLAGVENIITSERNTSIGQSWKGVFVERILSFFSNAIVVNSEAGRRQLIECKINGAPIVVIRNGLDFSVFSRATDVEVGRLRESIAVKSDEFLVLLPGRISRQKNPLLLLQAVKCLAGDIKGLTIAFAGNELDPKLLLELKSTAKQLDEYARCLFLGRRDDMALLYSSSDVVVLPSLWEGFPNVLLEAMACATPVIASDVSDNSEIVTDQVGCIFPSNDPRALAASILQMYELGIEGRREIGQNGRERAAGLCSLQTFGDRYLKLIQELQ